MSRLDSVSKQWIVIGAILTGAVYTQTSLRVLFYLPLDLYYRIAATPPMWGPLAGLLILMIGAVLLEGSRPSTRPHWLLWVVAGVAGCLGIIWFFRAGDLDWHASGDWKKEWTYYTAVREGLRDGQLPWYLKEFFQGTDRFFANPETPVAPHVLLMAWMGVSPFLVLQFVLLFIIGFAGFQRLAGELQLGPIASTAFIAILLLNGNLVGHLAAGHFQWAGYFVIPWVFLFLHRASAGDTGSRTQAGLGLALGLMVAVGGWHVFVWCVIFVGVFLLCNRARWWLGAGAAALAAGLIAYRAFPAILVFGAHDTEFLHSYEQITILLAALVGYPRDMPCCLFWFEYDAYVGWVGMVLVCAGFTAPLSRVWREPVAALWAPSVAMLVLSTFNIYKWTLFRLPGFVSERVASRLLVVGLLGFALLGCVQLNLWLTRRPITHARRAALALAGLLMAAQLLVRANAVRPASDQGLGRVAVNVISPRPPDRAYAASLAAGVFVSAISAAIAIRMWRRRTEFAS